MDAKFHPAIAAIMSGDIEGLRSLLLQDSSLATARSSSSHPTLLQCLALDAVNVSSKVEMAKLLVDAGAEINEPLVAAASIGNVDIAAFLLDRGAALNGTGNWSPLEEALYWNNQGVIDLLLARGASVHNLRIAAGLGRSDLIEKFFREDGALKPEAGRIAWPFGELQESNLSREIKQELQAKLSSWTNDADEIINNAFIYACMRNHLDAARLLLQKGAQVNAIPPSFDYSGTALHYAALNGHRALVDFLIEQGASANIKDTKVGATPAGWAEHGGHAELKNHLEEVARSSEFKQLCTPNPSRLGFTVQTSFLPDKSSEPQSLPTRRSIEQTERE
ncbi:MAG TPA: ankyrin repeat domain-containing protein [Pyrinomonadaceae bacterium]|jgi:ankyrin repeat protein|nr:ankyrin repeat domain-containing protein [Pyrinomonadaceae bacterium]